MDNVLMGKDISIQTGSILEAKTEFMKLFTTSPFIFDSGDKLHNVEVAYQTYGRLNSRGDNAVLICHALTGNSHAAGIIDSDELERSTNHKYLNKYNKMYIGKSGWWDALIGPGKTFDTNKYFVVCPNILGSCYGTSGPASINPETGDEYRLSFPRVTVRDMVRLEKELLDKLGVNKLLTAAGGSLGGMQVLEWGAMFPGKINSIIPIATAAAHPAWAIGLNRISIKAITSDPQWQNGNYSEQPSTGLAAAREVAMISYRSPRSFDYKFGRRKATNRHAANVFDVQSYLDYQGKKLVKRFDANTYLYLAWAMDNHDISMGRGTIKSVLNAFNFPVLSIGINSDLLYPSSEQKLIAENTPFGEYAEIKSLHGHDAFLIEFDQLERLIKRFLKNIA